MRIVGKKEGVSVVGKRVYVGIDVDTELAGYRAHRGRRNLQRSHPGTIPIVEEIAGALPGFMDEGGI